MNQSLTLLNQIIEMAEAQEIELKKAHLLQHKATRTLGESALLFHLKELLKLLQQECNAFPPVIQVGEKTLNVALGNEEPLSPIATMSSNPQSSIS